MLFPTNQNFLLSTFISSCVDETELCKPGVVLCPNKEDLKYCKNATSWTFDDSEWKPIDGMFLAEHTDVFVISPNRQTFYFPELENLNFGD